MRARDLAQPYVAVSKDADVLEAVRLLAENDLPGLLVLEPDGRPYTTLPASDLVRTLVPGYVQEDRVLAEVIDEPHADRLVRALAGTRLVDCLPVGRPAPPTADPDCTAMEIAELMARTRSPLVAVVERGAGTDPARLLGVITAAHLLRQLLEV